jgi:hypothetical protein
MKRYWLFAWPKWEQSGGMADFVGSYDSVKEAKSNVPTYRFEKTEGMIVDSQDLENWEYLK